MELPGGNRSDGGDAAAAGGAPEGEAEGGRRPGFALTPALQAPAGLLIG